MRRPGCLALAAALAACSGGEAPPPGSPDGGDAQGTATGPLAVLPIEPDPSRLPIVRGSIDGRPARLLIDTGASATIVSASFIGATPDQGTRVQSLCLGSVCLTQLGVWAADTPLSSPRPEEVQAVVGMNPLAGYVLDLDHGETVSLWREIPAATAGCRPPQALDLDDEGRPLLPARLDDRALGPVLLDTGSRYSPLDAATAAGASYLQDGAVETGACSIQGCTTGGSYIATARQLCAGETCLDQVDVKFPAWNAIGGSFLRRVRMIADLPARNVRFCD